jgi:hypothetical protein
MTAKDIRLRIGQALRLAPALLRRDPIFRYAGCSPRTIAEHRCKTLINIYKY